MSTLDDVRNAFLRSRPLTDDEQRMLESELRGASHTVVTTLTFDGAMRILDRIKFAAQRRKYETGAEE